MSKGARMGIDDLPPQYRQQVLNQLGHGKKDNSNRAADTPAHLEQTPCSKPVGKEEDQGHGTPGSCAIHIHSIRKRLCDPDGISAKSAIDGLVHRKILQNDSTKEIKEVTYSQEKGEPERTIITLTWD